MEDILQFDIPMQQSSYIKVIGVGGGGGNAVNHMYRRGIKGVDFIVCNTDASALDKSPVPNKIQLGKGLGAGNVPAVAEKAALDKADEIKATFASNTQMVFIAAGMGGGTGTGAAPVVAKLLKEIELEDDEVKNILTVAVVNTPYTKEGRKRIEQAKAGIEELRKYVDAIIIVHNDKLRELGGNCGMSQAFARADEIIATAVKGMAEIMTVDSSIHIDFRDVNTVVEKSGVALMSCGEAEGENRAHEAITQALASPLLNDNNIIGAKNVLLYFSSSAEHEMTHDEWDEITDIVLKATGKDAADMIWGMGIDDSLGDKLAITLVATGFSGAELYPNPEDRVVIRLDDKLPETEIAAPATPLFETAKAPERPAPPVYHIDDKWDEPFTASKPISMAQKTEASSLELSFNSLEQRFAETVKSNELPIDEIEPYLRPAQTEMPTAAAPSIDLNRFQNYSVDRSERLRQLSAQTKTVEGLEELERIPAYMRQNVKLEEPVHSSASEMPRYNLTENGKVVSNKFLHDNVD
ncbi:MAG: cell division protein FtsZ [Bacteroidales bacterium]|jgi:cell division protein FtsZ|nr:cell division protein FtsZ [Bacteroidales bacterium]